MCATKQAREWPGKRARAKVTWTNNVVHATHQEYRVYVVESIAWDQTAHTTTGDA